MMPIAPDFTPCAGRTPRRLKLGLTTCAAALLALGLAACSPIKTREQASEEFRQSLLSDRITKQFWEAIEEEFPDEFDRLINRSVDADLAGTLTQESGLAIGKQWFDEFVVTHGDALRSAPDPALTTYLGSTANLMVAFQSREIEGCAKLSLGIDFDTSEMSPRIQDAVQRNKIDMIRAMAAGERNPHERALPSTDDYVALGSKMRALGAGERLMEIAGDETQLKQASAEDQCNVGVILYQAAKALPGKQSTRIAADLLSPE